MSLKASISGIRGIVGESLTPPVIIDYIAAFSSIIGKGDILLGRDSRPTGEMISSLVKGALNALGRNVVDIGIIPTPVVLFGVAARGFAGGVIITASHNPSEWNALKLVNGKGKFLSPDEFKKLSGIYESKIFKYVKHDKVGSNSFDDNIPKEHLKKISSFIDIASIRKEKFKVVLDAVNGGGGPHTVKFLENAGCKVIKVNTEPTGVFAHPPEPTPANLKQLSTSIKKHGADIGFALDPDADRLVVADGKGNVLSEELTLALCVDHYLSKYGKTDVVINLSTSRVIEDITSGYKAKLHRVPTGEINVTEKMEKIKSRIGGEGNGGVIVPALNKCRDSLVGIALILEMLVQRQKDISGIAGEYPAYHLAKEKISAENIDFEALSDKIKFEFKDKNIDNQDGIRIDLEDKWVLVRKSNTEPIIRIFAEALSADSSKELIGRIKALLKKV
jgi:phosphomannomutase